MVIKVYTGLYVVKNLPSLIFSSVLEIGMFKLYIVGILHHGKHLHVVPEEELNS
jgi:hypothetical protein